jgi:hypothetical protein
LVSKHPQHEPALARIQIQFETVDGQDVCQVDARPAPGPVFMRPPKALADEFYVRTGNSTRQFTMQEYDAYRKERWD